MLDNDFISQHLEDFEEMLALSSWGEPRRVPSRKGVESEVEAGWHHYAFALVRYSAGCSASGGQIRGWKWKSALGRPGKCYRGPRFGLRMSALTCSTTVLDQGTALL